MASSKSASFCLEGAVGYGEDVAPNKLKPKKRIVLAYLDEIYKNNFTGVFSKSLPAHLSNISSVITLLVLRKLVIVCVLEHCAWNVFLCVQILEKDKLPH